MRFLLLFFVLALPALAKPTPTEIEDKTREWMKKGDLARIAWTVRHHREECAQLFEQRLGEQLLSPNPERLEWLNTIARAFRLEGMGRPNSLLQHHGLLWPITHWRGGMFEADGPQGEYDTHGTWD
mgnify:CR=1 FL=1